MGDGGFWHNGLTSGIGNAVFNRHDAVTVIARQRLSPPRPAVEDILSSRSSPQQRDANQSILDAVKGIGVKWVKRVHTYDMRETLAVLREALTTGYDGPKVIIAEGECQLNRQRRVRPLFKKAVAQGERVVRERFGIDASLCTGDHAPAFVSPDVHFTPSKKIRIHCARIPSRTWTTRAWAAAYAGKWRTRRCCARLSIVRTSSITLLAGTGFSMPSGPV